MNSPNPQRGRRLSVLPPSLPPRGISREQAAEYVGVSPSTFDKLVKDGRMSQPKRIDGRVVWEVRRLDCAFDALDDAGNGNNPWDET
jgi:excisionase family DNA binding protein